VSRPPGSLRSPEATWAIEVNRRYLIGALLPLDVHQHIKKNVIIFVTARIVTPAGLPLNEEEEEGLLPPELPEVPAYKK
jgi:hypothetical protein